MTVEDFYNLCDRLGMIDVSYQFTPEESDKIPNTLPELLSFLDEILIFNDKSIVKNLLLCMLDLPLGGQK